MGKYGEWRDDEPLETFEKEAQYLDFVNGLPGSAEKVRYLIARLSATESSVKEWICENCLIVYPGPPKEGVLCVECTHCGGSTKPMWMYERDKAKKERDEFQARLSARERELAELREKLLERLNEYARGQMTDMDGRALYFAIIDALTNPALLSPHPPAVDPEPKGEGDE